MDPFQSGARSILKGMENHNVETVGLLVILQPQVWNQGLFVLLMSDAQ